MLVRRGVKTSVNFHQFSYLHMWRARAVGSAEGYHTEKVAIRYLTMAYCLPKTVGSSGDYILDWNLKHSWLFRIFPYTIE